MSFINSLKPLTGLDLSGYLICIIRLIDNYHKVK